MSTTDARPSVLPAILVVDDTPESADLIADIRHRYDRDYEVLSAATAQAGARHLERCRAAGVPVALVLAWQWLAGPEGVTGVDVLRRTQKAFPDAKRVLMITYGDTSSTEPLLQAMTLGEIDQYLARPWGPPEERLYPAIADLLGQWRRATSATHLEVIVLVGASEDRRSHELRDLLQRNAVPFGFRDRSSAAGRRLLERLGLSGEGPPVAVLHDGRILVDPSDREVAESLGATLNPPAGGYDVVIVGGGPAGLTAAVHAASEGLRTVVLERLATGGQAGTTSMIRNYPGFQGISGSELTSRAAAQAILFGAHLVHLDPAIRLQVRDGDFVLTLASGTSVTSRTVVIATGVSYRTLPGLEPEAQQPAGVFYGAAVTEAAAMRGKRVHVVGGANSAGQAAVHLARYAAQVAMLVRGDSLTQSMSAYLIAQIDATPNITVRPHTEVVGARGFPRLERIAVRDTRTGVTEEVESDALFVLIGAEPHTGWLTGVARDEQGYLLTGTDLSAGRVGRPGGEPYTEDGRHLRSSLETSMPGVFAIGDVRRGSTKRIASAAGEGAQVVAQIHQYLSDAPP